MTCEEKLWYAVLELAFEDLTGQPRGLAENDRNPGKIQSLKKETRAWFRSERKDPCSFEWVCEQIGLDSGKIRDALFGKTDPKKPRTLGGRCTAFRKKFKLKQVSLEKLAGISRGLVHAVENTRAIPLRETPAQARLEDFLEARGF